MKKLITATAAAGVLVAGAFVASTVATSPAEAQTPDTTTEREARPERPDRGEIFEEVINDLVEEGTIDADQADAIKEAFKVKRDELVGELGPRSGRDGAFHRGAFRGLLADGVITQDEIDALPEDHPLRTGDSPLSELLEDDGQITQEELQQFRDENRPERQDQDGETG